MTSKVCYSYNGIIEKITFPLAQQGFSSFSLLGFLYTDIGEIQMKRVESMGFSYKEQYAVVVVCQDEKEQEEIYNRLKAEGYKLKVVAV